MLSECCDQEFPGGSEVGYSPLLLNKNSIKTSSEKTVADWNVCIEIPDSKTQFYKHTKKGKKKSMPNTQKIKKFLTWVHDAVQRVCSF